MRNELNMGRSSGYCAICRQQYILKAINKLKYQNYTAQIATATATATAKAMAVAVAVEIAEVLHK